MLKLFSNKTIQTNNDITVDSVLSHFRLNTADIDSESIEELEEEINAQIFLEIITLTFIYEKLYFEASELANELSFEVSNYFSKKIENVKCYDIERYVQEVENVEFVEYEFKNNLSKLMLGSVNKIHDEVIITTNKSLMLERKNFTKMHEIIHFYRDVPYLSESHAFFDSIIEGEYETNDLPREHRANIGASILMANDQALPYALKKFRNFDEVPSYFFMSKAALRIRIIQYLMFNRGLPSEKAFSLFKNYFYRNKLDLLQNLGRI